MNELQSVGFNNLGVKILPRLVPMRALTKKLAVFWRIGDNSCATFLLDLSQSYLERNMKLIKLSGAVNAAFILSFVASCGTSTPQINPSTRRSTDPVLVSVVESFRNGCVRNAPSFAEEKTRSAFASYQPTLAPGMMFLASGEPGRSCRVTVRGYGIGRPMPTVGDVNSLGQTLLAQVGGSFSPKSPDTGAGAARVKVNRKRYAVFGYLSPKGDLNFSVSE